MIFADRASLKQKESGVWASDLFARLSYLTKGYFRAFSSSKMNSKTEHPPTGSPESNLSQYLSESSGLKSRRLLELHSEKEREG